MPQGYLPNFDRIPFTINAGAITDISLVIRAEPVPVPPIAPPTTSTQPAAPTPTPTAPPVAPPIIAEPIPDYDLSGQGMIEIVTRAAGSGNPLSGGIFAVYRASDNRRMAELTTGAGGRAYLRAELGIYFVRELRPTFGFYLETERIFLEVGAGETVTLELTKVRDMSIADLPPDTVGGGIIYITQTGQAVPLLNYIGGGLLICIAITFSGLVLWELSSLKKKSKPRRRTAYV